MKDKMLAPRNTLLKASLFVFILLVIIIGGIGIMPRVKSILSAASLMKLTARDAAAGDNFGFSVSVSGDTAVVGAFHKDNGKGEVYVFTRSGSTWSQQGTLTAVDAAAGDYFGTTVSISGDTAVVGASYKDNFKGAAYVFTRSGSTWSQQAKLTAVDAAANDYFGYSVSASGDMVVVGAYLKDTNKGAAYVFVRSGSTWSQQARLNSSDPAANDYFGYSVSGSGDTVVVGAYLKDSARGAAYIFTRSGSAWSQQARLTPSDAVAGDNFGRSVSIIGDTVVVGAYGKDGGKGAAYVFTRSGSAWSQQAKLIAADAAAGDYFGFSVSLSDNKAVVGAYLKDSFKGAAYVFTRSGSVWSQQAKLTVGDSAVNDYFGYSVSVSGDKVAVGAPYKLSLKGAAYVRNLLPPNQLYKWLFLIIGTLIVAVAVIVIILKKKKHAPSIASKKGAALPPSAGSETKRID